METPPTPKPSLGSRLLKWLFALVAAGGLTIVIHNEGCNETIESQSLLPAASDTLKSHEIDTFDGVDTHGRTIRFKAYSLLGSYRWKKGSWDELERGPAVELIESYFKGMTHLHEAAAIVAVGMCSEEGEPKEEEARGQRRAEEISLALRPLQRSVRQPLYTLNLGRYRDSTDVGDTSEQRRVVVMGVFPAEPGVSPFFEDVRHALEDALSKRPPESYVRKKDYMAFILKFAP